MEARSQHPGAVQERLRTTVGQQRNFPSLTVLVYLLLALFFAFSTNALAQRRNTRTYSSNDGLPQSQITSIYQDKAGYLWLGTYSGVVRYNGHRWDVFDNNNGLYNNTVYTITGDDEGRIYFGTAGGVAIYHNGEFTHINKDDGLSDNTIYDLFVDDDGTLWIAANNGLNSYSPDGTLASYGYDQGLNAYYITKVFKDSSDTLWIGTYSGLFRKDVERFTQVSLSQEGDPQSINDIFEDKEGRLIIATSGKLLRATSNGVEDYGKQLGLEELEFLSLEYGPNGNLWVGTDQGAFELNENEAIPFTEEDGLADEQTSQLLLDKESNLWIGTENGITKISPGVFVYYNTVDGLPSSEVFDIASDSEGNIWVATEDGLAIYSPDMKLLDIMDSKDGLDSDLVNAVEQGPGGKMFIGTGLSTWAWDGKKLSVVENTFGATCMMTDSKGRLWLGATLGLGWIEPDAPETLQEFPYDHPINSYYICTVAEDSQGRIWVGTSGGGCFVFDGKDYTVYDAGNGLSSQDIWDIAADPQGGVWIGTNGDGLFRYRDGAFTQYTMENGLRNNFVWQILVDNENQVWVNTNFGMDVFDGELFTHFDENDGLAANEGTAAGRTMDNQGRLWFASSDGLSMSTSSSAKTRSHPVPPLIESISVGDTTYDYPEALKLKPNENTLSINFTSLYFRNESALKFRYRLEGLEKDWNGPAHIHNVRYAQIPPGSYQFHVEATTDNGHTWNHMENKLPILIETPFHQTPSFIGLVIAALSFGAMAVYRLHAAKVQRDRERLEMLVDERTEELAEAVTNLKISNVDLERVNKDLQAFSSSVSHDLRAPLNRIRGYTQLLEDQIGGEVDGESKKYLDRIVGDARRMGELIQDLLKLSLARETEINKESVDLTAICKDVVSNLQENDYGRVMNVRIENNMIVEGEARLLRIVMENLLGNAWKFTSGRDKPMINVSAHRTDEEIIISVKDNGIGFDQDRVDKLFNYFGRLHDDRRYRGLGIGLVTVKRIIDRLGGRVWAEGIIDEGASFYFSLKHAERRAERIAISGVSSKGDGASNK